MRNKREFKETDFMRVSEFLKKTYSQSTDDHNWFIDRWNFCRYFAQPMLGTFAAWPKTVGLWVDEKDNILSVVNSEGENSGEAFLQLSHMTYSHDFLNEMIDFAENKLSCVENNERNIYIRVNSGHTQLKELLKNRNYTPLEWGENNASMDLDGDFQVNLPKGFRICNGHEVDDYQKGLAHTRAFSHSDSSTPEGVTKRVVAYKAMKNAPDYKPELDLCILDDHDDIAAFATVWYDELNGIGILEPVGTIPKYRRLGLGKAVIYEGINSIKELGAKKIYVGSSQKFYLSIGFSIEFTKEVWHKKWSMS